MRRAVIVEAVRTPIGKRNGAFAALHPVDLAAAALLGVVDRAGIDPAILDDVIAGCVTQSGGQAANIARNAVLAAGFPVTVPGTTVERQCGSSQQAIQFAAAGIVAGHADAVAVVGIEHMTAVPMIPRGDSPALYGRRVTERFAPHGGLVDLGAAGDALAGACGLSREQLDAFALRSHHRASHATESGRFAREIVPVVVASDAGSRIVDRDEGIRPDTTAERLAALSPAFSPDGLLTAGSSSQISDGAAAVLVMEEAAAARLGLRPLAALRSFAVAAADPIEMLTAPVPASRRALARAGLTIDDIDLIEVNEAFASVALAVQRELGVDDDVLNVNGGAIALGHPLGCSGARLACTLVHELGRRGQRFGLQTMCEAGGLANATVFERLDG